MSGNSKAIAVVLSLLSSVALGEIKPSISCTSPDGTIEIALNSVIPVSGPGLSGPEDITWKKSKSAPAELYSLLSATEGKDLWPMLPEKFTEYPMGSYVGRGSDGTIILDILRPASMGGSGYSWEGSLTYIALGGPMDGRAFSWGMLCSL